MRRDTRRLWDRVLVPALIVLLGSVFVLATYLSYYAARDIRSAFAYQEAVVSAERDGELLQYQMRDPSAPDDRRAMYAKLLAGDLERIDALATSADERAPSFVLDESRLDFAELEIALGQLDTLGRARFDETSSYNERTRDIANLLFGAVALAFTIAQARLRRRVEEGRTLVEGLQRAFLARRRTLPNVRAGSVLLSATRGSNVGGDVHDVFTFDGRYGMFLIADVSGKGLDAAVDTVFIKYAIRTLFSETTDPGVVLSRFATLYERAAENPENFVVAFLGVIDTTTGHVRYASAGHEPAFAKCAGVVTTLAPTGPVVGIFADTVYGTGELVLARGDLIALATDGLTESRDRRGTMLGAEGVALWLGEVAADGSAMAERIAVRLRRRSRTVADDLAILTLEYAPGRRLVVEEPVREAVSTQSLVSAP